MSDEIPNHYTTQFGTNWKHNVQQRVNRLKDCVMVDTIDGKEKSYNQIGKSKMRLITTRNGKTIPSNTPLNKRWIRPQFFDEVSHFDEWDDRLLGNVVLPTSETIQSHDMAYARTSESVIIDALLGTAYIGTQGTDAVDLPSSQKIAVSYVKSGSATNSGLTLAKLIKAKSILGKNEVYEDQGAMAGGDSGDKLVAVVSQAQLDDLLHDVDQASNADYAAVKALVEGQVNHFMGFHFKRTEQLPLDAATDIRSCVFYAKSGLQFTDGSKKVKISVRDDLNETLQIRSKAAIGAARLEEEKVVEVFCDESP